MSHVNLSTSPRLSGLGFTDVFTQLGGWPVMPSGWSTAQQAANQSGHSVPVFLLPGTGFLIYVNPNATVGRAKQPSNTASIKADDPYFVNPGDDAWVNLLYSSDVRANTTEYAGYNTGVMDIQTQPEFQAQLEAFGRGEAPSPIPGLYYTAAGTAAYGTPPPAATTVIPVQTAGPEPIYTTQPVISAQLPAASPSTSLTTAPSSAQQYAPQTAVPVAAADTSGQIFGIDQKYVLIGGAALVLVLLMGGKK